MAVGLSYAHPGFFAVCDPLRNEVIFRGVYLKWNEKVASVCILQLLMKQCGLICAGILPHWHSIELKEPSIAKWQSLKVITLPSWSSTERTLQEIAGCVRSATRPWSKHVLATRIFALVCTTSTVIPFTTVLASPKNHMPSRVRLLFTRRRHKAPMVGWSASWSVWWSSSFVST